MNIEKTTAIVILGLNLCGFIFLVSVGIKALLKRYMARFETTDMDDDDLFVTSGAVLDPPPPDERPESVKKDISTKKPEFNLDDFDFDL